ncbi:hypothetical protein CBL_13809 [Carabus blaptoides fortunei]
MQYRRHKFEGCLMTPGTNYSFAFSLISLVFIVSWKVFNPCIDLKKNSGYNRPESELTASKKS